ncbi:hypothetical protein [Rhizobium rhizogenes]|uniref:hypothetical protein n=1 Tax=Rhizobium rhizogenes TaxID=359 RepID=UPI001573E525|nr:hypothetical protein [Rhizobium rhizogenes]NTF43090.1 hypothetical protein [Rhizobium rhizogenes]
MTNPITRASEAMHTRRRALGFMAAITASTATVAAAAPFLRDKPSEPALSREEQLEAAIVAMEAAMIAIHGTGVRIIRNENHLVSFIEPEKPSIVEFQGTGYYEIKIADNLAPIFHVVRFSAFDDFKDGRCFRLEPRDAKRLGIRYMYEHDLQRVIIRKI